MARPAHRCRKQGGYCGGYEIQGWLTENLEGSRVALTIGGFLHLR
jgi:hypothetical protein